MRFVQLGWASALYMRAAHLFGTGHPREAEPLFRRALDLQKELLATPQDDLTFSAGSVEVRIFAGVEIRDPPTLKHVLANTYAALIRLLLMDADRLGEAETLYREAEALGLKEAVVPNFLAWQLANSPHATVRNPARAVALAKQAVQLGPREGDNWGTLGTAQYRAGSFQEAVTTLQKAMQLRNGGDSLNWFFLAMAYWQLGDKDRARLWYDRSVAWMEKNGPSLEQDQSIVEELRRIRSEAEEVLELKKK
jgi:tetratricopeptide (TPR) repeat protein